MNRSATERYGGNVLSICECVYEMPGLITMLVNGPLGKDGVISVVNPPVTDIHLGQVSCEFIAYQATLLM